MILHAVAMGPSAIDCLKGGKNSRVPTIGIFENAKAIVDRLMKEENRSVFIVANMGLCIIPHHQIMLLSQ